MRDLFEKSLLFYPEVSLYVTMNLSYQYGWMRQRLFNHLKQCPEAFTAQSDAIVPLLSVGELKLLGTATNYFNTCVYTTPIVSLIILQKCPEHEKLVSFALASLSYFPPATIFFYIPQIVQLLRKDPFGK